MKIRNDGSSLEALIGCTESASLRAPTDADFEAVLSEKMDKGAPQAQADAVPVPGGEQAQLISQILLGAGEDSGAQAQEFTGQALRDVSGALDMWDSYIEKLGSRSADSLRDAYALLQGIDSKLSELRNNTEQFEQEMPGFSSLMNELAVLTTTEKFKFNRGDYIA